MLPIAPKGSELLVSGWVQAQSSLRKPREQGVLAPGGDEPQLRNLDHGPPTLGHQPDNQECAQTAAAQSIARG